MTTHDWTGNAPEDPHIRSSVKLLELGKHDAPVLRVASYNIRVDHCDDEKIRQNPALAKGRTPGQYPWDGVPSARRQLVVEIMGKLDCDLICIQEPSPDQCMELQQDFAAAGLPLAVHVLACNPSLWGPGKPSKPRGERHGQDWDGNGFIWNCSRLRLEGSLEQFWLSPTPNIPSSAHEAWPNSSKFFRTCVAATFRDLKTQATIRAFSVHFDHQGGKLESSKCLMEKVREDVGAAAFDCLLLCGDFNTFPQEQGETYRALLEECGDHLVDVRGVDGKKTHRGDDTWMTGGRFDHMFISPSVTAIRTAVVEDVPAASDHRPIVAEIRLAL